MNQRPHGIMFHHFHDNEKHPKGQGSISSDEFEKMILYLKKNYNLLSANEWYERAQNHKLCAHDICITFDDNLLCQYEIALPVLEEFNIKAFWFVYTSPVVGIKENLEIYRYFRSTNFSSINEFYEKFNSFVSQSTMADEVEQALKKFDPDKYLSSFPFYTKEDKIFRYIRDQILGKDRYNQIMHEMIRHYKMDVEKISANLWNDSSKLKYLNDTGHILGLHSHTHPTEMNKLSYEEQLKEYQNNYNTLSPIIGKKIFSMSHPCNSYNNDTLTILHNMGIDLGFRANMDEGYVSNLEYPRLDHALLLNNII